MVGHSPDCSHDSGSLRSKRLVPVGEELIKQYTPLVARVVRTLGFHMSGHDHNGMEVDDAMQSGYIGLLKARKHYNPNLMSSKIRNGFMVFAATQIKQEILDEMARCRWLTGDRNKTRHCLIMNRCMNTTQSYEHVLNDVEREEWEEKLEDAVDRLDWKRRQIYQGVMRNDGSGKAGYGGGFCENTGMSPQSLSYFRKDIRNKLKEALH